MKPDPIAELSHCAKCHRPGTRIAFNGRQWVCTDRGDCEHHAPAPDCQDGVA